MVEDKQWLPAVVLDVLPKGLYRVRCSNGREITAALSREYRRVGIRVVPGDEVEVSPSTYDRTRGTLRRL